MSGRGVQGRGYGGHYERRYIGCGRGSGHYTPTLNKNKFYKVHLETTSLIMVIKGDHTRCGLLGRI